MINISVSLYALVHKQCIRYKITRLELLYKFAWFPQPLDWDFEIWIWIFITNRITKSFNFKFKHISKEVYVVFFWIVSHQMRFPNLYNIECLPNTCCLWMRKKTPISNNHKHVLVCITSRYIQNLFFNISLILNG